MAVKVLQMTAASTPNNWNLAAGASKQAAVATPDDDATSYINSGTTNGTQQQFSVNNHGLDSTITISNVAVKARCMRGGSQNCNYVVTVVLGANTAQGASQSGGASWATSTDNFATKPPSGAWTATDIDNLEVRIQNSQGRDCRCTSLTVEVTYVLRMDSSTQPAGAGTCSGGLSVTHNLAGSASAQGFCLGSLSVTKALAGSATGDGTASGSLTVEAPQAQTHYLSGSATGDGTASGTMTHKVYHSGSATGAGDCTGSLTVSGVQTHYLSGTITGTSVSEGGFVWTPKKLGATLRGWFKVGMESYANNDPVGTLHDQSGNGFDGTQSDGAKKPLFHTNVQNGKPSIYFSGEAAGHYLDTTITDAFGDFSVFVIAKGQNLQPVWGNGHCRMVCKSYAGGFYMASSATTLGEPSVPDVNRFKTGIKETSGYYGLTLIAMPSFLDKAMLFELRRNGTSKIMRAQGRAFETTATVTDTACDGTALRIGYPVAGEGDNAWGGDIFEIIVCDSNLSDADLAKIYEYANSEYNLWQELSGAADGAGDCTGTLTVQAGAGTVNLSGTASGAATTDGTISQTVPLAGAASATGEATGGLTVTKLLQGNVTGDGTSAATLSITKALSGTVDGTGEAAGTLSKTVLLAGSAAGAGEAAGAVRKTTALSGSITGDGTASGTLSQTVLLAGSATGAGSASGTFLANFVLAGSIGATGQASGTLTVIPYEGAVVHLSGSATGDATATGALRKATLLSGASEGAGNATALLSLEKRLTGQIDATATVSGTLRAYQGVALSGSATGTGTATGSFTVAYKLAGAATATGTATGQVRKTTYLSGTITGASTCTGAIRHTVKLAGAGAGAATATGTLSKATRLQGAIAATGQASGIAKVNLYFSGVINCTSTVTGLVRAEPPLVLGRFTLLGTGERNITIIRESLIYTVSGNGATRITIEDTGETKIGRNY